MLKKILLGTLFAGFIGILIYGAIVRTSAKVASNSGEGQGSGSGTGRGRTAVALVETDPVNGQSQGQGQGRGQAARAIDEPPAAVPELKQNTASQSDRVDEWQIVEGTVSHVEAEVVTVALADNRQVLVEGQAWAYAQLQAFSLQAGDQVVLMIFEEDDELKAGRVDNLTTGKTLTLRLEDGQPMWSTGLQNGQNAFVGTGQGRGAGEGQGAGRNSGGRGQGNAASEQTSGDALAIDRLVFEGIAVTVDAGHMMVEANTGEPVLIEGRAWSYALENGFEVEQGQLISLTGFIENGEVKAITLENLSSGQHIAVRDDNARPLWSGGRRDGV